MRQNSCLAARQCLGRLKAFLTAEQHLPEKPMNVLPGRIRIEPMQPFDRRHAFLDRAGVILREVADRDLMSPPHGTAVEVRGGRRQIR